MYLTRNSIKKAKISKNPNIDDEKEDCMRIQREVAKKYEVLFWEIFKRKSKEETTKKSFPGLLEIHSSVR